MPSVFAMYATVAASTSAISVVNLGTAATAVVRSLTICNAHTASTASVDVFVNQGVSTTPVYVHRYSSLSARETVQALSQPLILNAGDALRISSPAASEVHAIASVMRVS